MPYAIMRCEKIKSGSRAAVIHAHNIRSSNPINADPSGQIVALVPCADLPSAIDARIESAGAKRRANSVIAQEMILTASPEYFRPADPARAGHWEKAPTDSWVEASRQWLQSEFGDRLVAVNLHLDEATPHLHAVIVPITEDNRLSAKDLFNPISLQKLQSSYAGAVAHLGLSRGIEGSVATHEEISKYYERVNGPAPAPPTIPTPPLMGREQWAENQTDAVAQAVKPLSAQAQEMQRSRTLAKEARETAKRVQRQAEDWKREADRVRDIPLPDVLRSAGLSPDPADKKQWRGDGLRISVDGAKWFDHEAQKGGGGAIDLAIHITGARFRDAVAWLGGSFDPAAVEAAAAHRAVEAARTEAAAALKDGSKAGPPAPDDETWPRVRQYLVEKRALKGSMIDWCHDKLKKVYSDSRNNAVFVYGFTTKPDQVELRGTGKKPFHGFRGAKDSIFYLPPGQNAPKRLAVVESAIEALSYRQLNQSHRVVAVGGGCSDLVLRDVAELARKDGLTLVAAFNADQPGEKFSQRLESHAFGIEFIRERPKRGKDWNEYLQLRAKAPAPAPSPALEESGASAAEAPAPELLPDILFPSS